MPPLADPFTFDYYGTDIVYGRGCLDRLESRLEQNGLERALLVCGSNVGANEALMDPVRAALGDRLVSVFDETTPAKSIETVYDGIEAMVETDADVAVGVGGGSSLDVARQISAFAADGRSMEAFREAARAGRLSPPAADGGRVPVVIVPTTFAGADLSSGGSIEVLGVDQSPTDNPIRTNGRVDPEAVLYDPALYETTPLSPLAGSVMNGFDKGLETVYSRNASPITDATAVRGLSFLRGSLPDLASGEDEAMERAVTGHVLVQFKRDGAIIHAFGHGLARRYPLQQGVAHAAVAPSVLRYVLGEVDARPTVLAEGLGVDPSLPDADLAAAIVDEVAAIRDSLPVPGRLREIDAVDPADFPAIAEYVHEDGIMDRNPEGLDPTVADIEGVLEAAW